MSGMRDEVLGNAGYGVFRSADGGRKSDDGAQNAADENGSERDQFGDGVRPGTVCEWLRRAAEKAEEINQHLMRELGISQVQLDEM